jgi:aryl-alcohol dehydrogenase-like predicted oxidoreductase
MLSYFCVSPKYLHLTTDQLALAWLLHQGQNIVPIPGTRKILRIDENAKSASTSLEQATLRRIDEIMPIGWVVGNNLINILIHIGKSSRLQVLKLS